MRVAKVNCATARSLIVVALSGALAASATANTWYSLGPDGTVTPSLGGPREALVTVTGADEQGLEVTVALPGLELGRQQTAAGSFVSVCWPGAGPFGAPGEPLLPVVRRLMVVPPGAEVRLAVATAPPITLDLEAVGFAGQVVPRQPAVSPEEGEPVEIGFFQNLATYATDRPLPEPRAVVRRLGVVRGYRLHLLEVRPVAYNPARNLLVVWPRVDVSVRFSGGGEVQGRGGLPPLKGVLLNPPEDSRLNGRGSPNYLIIVADDYADAIAPFAAAKTAQGYNVITHAVPAGTNRTVIKDYILSLWGTPDAPDFILLVGEGGDIPWWWGGGAKRAPTDLPYACMDPGDDWYPDIAIGRFSVSTTQQLSNAIAKTLYIENAEYTDGTFLRRAAFMCGTDAETGDEATHDWVINTYLLPADFTCDRNYMRSEGATTEDVRNSFNAGCMYGVYYGHAWDNGWQDGPRFLQSDVNGLDEGGLCVFLVHLTCNMGTYLYANECFTETWLRVLNKGAVTNIGASEEIYYQNNPGWPEISDLEKFVFDSIYLDQLEQISPIWQAALLRLLAEYGPDHPPVRDYFEMFNLMGDPALALPELPGFELSADPAHQAICCPPDTSAPYTIEVEPTPGFDDPVLLTASGNPPGSDVIFTVNNVPPPFTSTMLVANIAPGTTGQFTIEVLGTAPGVERSVSVELHVADGVPPAVTLLAPSDGATEVSREPTLFWMEAAQALEYEVEIARDADFTDIVYSALESGTTHTVANELDADTTYYWHVRGSNACGPGAWSPTWHFTTLGVHDYFTEQFVGDFDLAYTAIEFVPDGSDDFYDWCAWPITQLPHDPSTGTDIVLGDDRYEQIWLEESRTVRLYNFSYTNFYVGSNGYITFTAGDTEFEETLQNHFDLPRISLLFDDLNPQEGGRISWEQFDEGAVVTYENVPERGTGNSNTFQVEMFYDGKIRISWLGVDSGDSIVGLSQGYGLPPDFVESDLSSGLPCCRGDFNYDRQRDLGDLAIMLSHYPMASGAEYEEGDFDLDGDIDLSDLAGLLSVYRKPCD